MVPASNRRWTHFGASSIRTTPATYTPQIEPLTMSNDSDDRESPPKAELERAMRFLHLLDMQADAQAHETSATLYALIEELVSVGVVDLRNLEARRERARVREA